MRRSAFFAVLSILVIGGLAGAQTGVGLRLIVVPTEAQAVELRGRALSGEPFDQLALAYSTDPSRDGGGYIGAVTVGDLSQAYQDALEGLAPGEISPVAHVGSDYILLQMLSETETGWLTATEAGMQALDSGRFPEARTQLEEALQRAEAFPAGDYRLNVTLGLLANLARVQGNIADAERYYQRAIELTERTQDRVHPDTAVSLSNLGLLYLDEGKYAEAGDYLNQAQDILVDLFGPNDPNVALGFNDLARLRQAEGDYMRAESLYEVALSILEQSVGPDDLAVADTLDGLSALLRLSGRDGEASQADARAQSIRDSQPNP